MRRGRDTRVARCVHDAIHIERAREAVVSSAAQEQPAYPTYVRTFVRARIPRTRFAINDIPRDAISRRDAAGGIRNTPSAKRNFVKRAIPK